MENYHVRMSRRTPQQTHDYEEADWSSSVYEGRQTVYSPRGGTDPVQAEGINRAIRPYEQEMDGMGEDSEIPEGVYPRDSRSVPYTGSNYMQGSDDEGSEGESADVYLTGPKAGSDMRVTRKKRPDGSWETSFSKASGSGWKKLPGPDNENFYEEGNSRPM
jgi:hypothetical protein